MTRGAGATGPWWRPGWARPLPPLVADGLLAGGLGLLSVTSALSDRRRGAEVPTLGLALLATLAPALLIRRRLPGTSLAAALTAGQSGDPVVVLPGGQLGVYVALAAVAGVLAVIAPARRAARLDVLTAIATE